MTIERERPVRIDDGKSGLVLHLLRDLRAVGLPEPVQEHHFDGWCCEHPKAVHRPRNGKQGPYPWCEECDYAEFERASIFTDDAGEIMAAVDKVAIHEYRRGRLWRFDLAWVAERLAVEVDGGTWSGGRHTRGRGFEADLEKLNAAVLQGWRVLRFTDQHIESGYALETVEAALKGRRT